MATDITIDVSQDTETTLLLGRSGENEVTSIAFEFSAWAEEYGSGIMNLIAKRPGDEEPYPVTLETAGTTSVWTISDYDTSVKGRGTAQLVYVVEDAVKKSVIFKTRILESILSSVDPPDPYDTYIDRLVRIASEAEGYASEAESAAGTATTQAEAASASAAAALTSETNAGESRTSAAESASIAEINAGAALASERNAATSASAAESSAASAAASEEAAAGSASTAAARASAAETSKTNAAASASAAAASAERAQEIADAFGAKDTGNGHIVVTL